MGKACTRCCCVNEKEFQPNQSFPLEQASPDPKTLEKQNQQDFAISTDEDNSNLDKFKQNEYIFNNVFQQHGEEGKKSEHKNSQNLLQSAEVFECQMDSQIITNSALGFREEYTGILKYFVLIIFR